MGWMSGVGPVCKLEEAKGPPLLLPSIQQVSWIPEQHKGHPHEAQFNWGQCATCGICSGTYTQYGTPIAYGMSPRSAGATAGSGMLGEGEGNP